MRAPLPASASGNVAAMCGRSIPCSDKVGDRAIPAWSASTNNLCVYAEPLGFAADLPGTPRADGDEAAVGRRTAAWTACRLAANGVKHNVNIPNRITQLGGR